MRVLSFVLACGLLVGAMACAGGSSIVSPDITPDRETTVSSRHLWGLYNVTIDPVSLEATVVPARTAEFRMNVNVFMNKNPALLGISIVDASNLLTTGEITLDVTLTHPVPTKPKLAGFDVCAVFLSNVSDFLSYDPDLAYPMATFSPLLLNPDGWTRWYNAIEFTDSGLFGYTPGLLGNLPLPQATLNGYKLFADGLAPTADTASWLTANQDSRAFFAAGSENTREFQLQFPLVGGKPFLKFQYAVLASWAKPTGDDPGPDDFPPEANIQEAAHLRIDTAESTLYYTIDEQGGDLVVNVDVFDWQGGADIEGEVARVIIECEVLNDPYIDDSPNLAQGSGDAFATFTATIPADTVTSTDDVVVWVIVESADPVDYNNGTGADYPEGKALAAINSTTASVSDEAPAKPPEIISGIDIVSGTTLCPDRTTDDNAIFEVVAVGDLPLTYLWTIIELKSPLGEAVPGYDNNPGDGAGHLTVDFTDTVFSNITELLLVNCEVGDGVNDPAYGTPLDLYLDCIIFHADLNDQTKVDNTYWIAMDVAGEAVWMPTEAVDGGSNLTGTGALFQDRLGGVSADSKGLLLSAPILIGMNVTSATLEIRHSYSFDPITMGGNVRMGEFGNLITVDQAYLPIQSGQAYDGALTDDTNPMHPQEVFSASGSSGSYLSVVQVPPSLLGEGKVLQVGFAAASGGTAYPDGGWLIDDVMVIVVL